MEPISHFNPLSPWEPGMFAFLLYGVLVFALAGLLLWIAGWLGEKKPSPEKGQPYECGVIPTGTASLRDPVAFYLVAAFFLIFDVEAVYIFSWAIAFERLGWSGWLQISFFMIVLLVSLFYLWKKGGLEWGPQTPKTRVTQETSS
jgi:NADH-quinone oxidoreductase subunit A